MTKPPPRKIPAAAPKLAPKRPPSKKVLPVLAFDTFEGTNGGWFWRMGPKTGGRRTGDGSEGYRTRSAARAAIRRLVEQCRRVVMIDDVYY
jgi:hypothetical protein